MIESFLKVAKRLKTYNDQKIGNTCILCLCQLTVLMILAWCAVITSQQHFGEPIQCVENSYGSIIPENALNSFCYVSLTYSRLDDTGKENIFKTSGRVKEHSYYPWVPIFTFIQGLSFLCPQVIWSMNENNSYIEWCLMQSKTSLNKDYLEPMAKYISKRINFLQKVMVTYLFGEIVFVVIVLCNFFITDIFLGGNFLEYGYKVLSNSTVTSNNIFPKMIECAFYKYGPSGSIELIDALCLLTLNVINEKLYQLLWFWFLILFVLSLIILLRRIIYFLIFAIRHNCPVCIRMTFVGNLSRNKFSVLLQKLTVSDWLFLEHLKGNMDRIIYIELLEKIACEISEPKDIVKGYGFI